MKTVNSRQQTRVECSYERYLTFSNHYSTAAIKKHTKIYLEYFGYVADPGSYIPCEICQSPAKDINHIDARGMGGRPKNDLDVIENLMAVCRECHVEYGDIKELKDKLKEIHMKFMQVNGPTS